MKRAPLSVAIGAAVWPIPRVKWSRSLMTRSAIAVAAVVLPLVLLAFSPLDYRMVDDAYISFRYSRNLAHGLGLVFNKGEYVEGFTNLLWTLMLTIPERFGLPVDIVAFWLGIGFGLLALRETTRLAILLGATARAQAIGVLMLALYPSFWRAAGNGLEAGLLAFLVTRTVCLAIMSRPFAAGVTAGLLFLTRPDTLLVGPLVALYAISRSSVSDFSRSFVDRFKRQVLPVVGPWAAIVSIATAWRLSYYDAWLPNTVTAKSLPMSFTWDTLRDAYWNSREGIAYWTRFLYSALPLTIGSLLAALHLKNRAVWLCLGVLAVQLPVVLMNAGDWMEHHRLLAPYAPLLAGLFAVGVDTVIEMRPGWRTGPVGWLSGANVGVLILSVAVMLGDHQWISRPQLLPVPPPSCFETLARLLRPVLMPGESVSPEELGIFSYRLPDIYVHDFMGLTDRRVATEGTLYLRQYGKALPSYTYDVVRPHVIIVHSGFGHLRPMAQTSAGRFNEAYSTYSLEKVPPCSDGVLVSIRTDLKARILLAFMGVELKQVLVPLTGGSS